MKPRYENYLMISELPTRLDTKMMILTPRQKNGDRFRFWSGFCQNEGSISFEELPVTNIRSTKLDQAYLILSLLNVVPDTKKKINPTKDDYNKALASDDPTKITTSDLENLAKEAMKKFKSL